MWISRAYVLSAWVLVHILTLSYLDGSLKECDTKKTKTAQRKSKLGLTVVIAASR